MKTTLNISVLFLFLFFAGKGFSQGSSLIIYSGNGEKFTLELSGVMQNDTPESKVRVDNLYTPSFKVRIFLENAQAGPISKTIFNTPNSELFYRLDKDAKGKYILAKTKSDWVESSDHQEEVPPPPPPDQDERAAEPEHPDNVADIEPGIFCNDPMPEPDFQASYIGISAQPFEGGQLGSAKKLADKNCLTTYQIVQLMYLFSMEPSRLDFAKYAYNHCYDPENYSDVRESLSYNSSKSSLDKYIATQSGK